MNPDYLLSLGTIVNLLRCWERNHRKKSSYHHGQYKKAFADRQHYVVQVDGNLWILVKKWPDISKQTTFSVPCLFLFFSSPQIYCCPLILKPKVMLDNVIILTLSAFGCSAWSPNSSSLTYHLLLVISTRLDTQHFPSTFYLLRSCVQHWATDFLESFLT